MSTPGSIIRNRRKKLGWIQWGLAEKIGVSIATISRIEQGKSYPGDKLTDNIAKALNLDPEELKNKFEEQRMLQLQSTQKGSAYGERNVALLRKYPLALRDIRRQGNPPLAVKMAGQAIGWVENEIGRKNIPLEYSQKLRQIRLQLLLEKAISIQHFSWYDNVVENIKATYEKLLTGAEEMAMETGKEDMIGLAYHIWADAHYTAKKPVPALDLLSKALPNINSLSDLLKARSTEIMSYTHLNESDSIKDLEKKLAPILSQPLPSDTDLERVCLLFDCLSRAIRRQNPPKSLEYLKRGWEITNHLEKPDLRRVQFTRAYHLLKPFLEPEDRDSFHPLGPEVVFFARPWPRLEADLKELLK